MSSTPTVGMEQWNGMQIYAIRLSDECHNNRESVEIDISVAQHHSLGVGAGAAGIEQFSQGVFVEVHDIGPVRRSRRQNVFIISWGEPGSLRCSVKHEESLHSGNALPKRI